MPRLTNYLSYFLLGIAFVFCTPAWGRVDENDTDKKIRFIDWLLPQIEEAKEEIGGVAGDIPNSLIIAQAVLETGWGESLAARRRFNLFGLTVNSGRSMGFKTHSDSVRYYLKNLSNHRAYAKLRGNLGKSNVYALTNYLTAYSESPQYPRKLRDIIRQNNLTEFDT